MKNTCEHRLTIDSDRQTLREIDRVLKDTPVYNSRKHTPPAIPGDYLLEGDATVLAEETASLAKKYPKAAFSLQCETASGQYSELFYLHGRLACRITGRIERFETGPACAETIETAANTDLLLPPRGGHICFQEYYRGAPAVRLEACVQVLQDR